ncbi:hypothetical protein ASPWEDRAFT_296979 [Aspergillus wentii DTO 134E9]|uniref:Uncharacterized protein n=1 Tax=Aspergillus wentii DTO 134E9 TaxID=1073089 RepID=A0A1L9R4D1_ASPWE|nr:uncharacterized protein ASPWEDRAFT_296979 [Aspergillus wentii DTO 134E9]OJJ29781.1 hypothetical protein ASPWEDRAFT_296979 [Aspergillus wentii DTO 134E9]
MSGMKDEQCCVRVCLLQISMGASVVLMAGSVVDGPKGRKQEGRREMEGRWGMVTTEADSWGYLHPCDLLLPMNTPHSGASATASFPHDSLMDRRPSPAPSECFREFKSKSQRHCKPHGYLKCQFSSL